MSRTTNVSPYRSGAPRFGRKSHEPFDNSVKTYKLTPEEIAEMKSGKPLEEIIEAREKDVNKPKVIAYSKYEQVVAELDKLKHQVKTHPSEEPSKEFQVKLAAKETNIRELLKRIEELEGKLGEKDPGIEKFEKMYNELQQEKDKLEREVIWLYKELFHTEDISDKKSMAIEDICKDAKEDIRMNAELENEIHRLKSDLEVERRDARYWMEKAEAYSKALKVTL